MKVYLVWVKFNKDWDFDLMKVFKKCEDADKYLQTYGSEIVDSYIEEFELS